MATNNHFWKEVRVDNQIVGYFRPRTRPSSVELKACRNDTEYASNRHPASDSVASIVGELQAREAEERKAEDRSNPLKSAIETYALTGMDIDVFISHFAAIDVERKGEQPATPTQHYDDKKHAHMRRSSGPISTIIRNRTSCKWRSESLRRSLNDQPNAPTNTSVTCSYD